MGTKLSLANKGDVSTTALGGHGRMAPRAPRLAPLAAALLALGMLAGCASPPADKPAAPADTTTAPAADNPATTQAVAPVKADAPISRTAQAPGFVRMQMGAITVTALYDGKVEIDAKLLKGKSAASIAQLLRQGKQPANTGVQTAVNAFLLDDGKHKVLVDTGAAGNMGATAGRLLESLASAGYSAAEVSAVLLTHLHPDHAGGLLRDGVAAFPNAHIYAAKEDADFWLSEEVAKKAPAAAAGVFAAAQKAVAPYVAEQRFHTFGAGKLPIEGFDAIALHGHTPGHTGFQVQSGGETLLLWGDVVHSHTTQFADPSVALEYDSDAKKARTTRIKLMREVAKSGVWIAGAHMPFPGIGRVLPQGKAYRWLPLDYSQALSDADKRQPDSKR